MHVIEADNIRDALPLAFGYVIKHGIQEETRQGPVFAAPGPVTILYKNPKQHVLLNPNRDANPFFHLMEAIWMLAGRQDGAFLDHYIKNFSESFGNNGIIMDAYGFRWRYGLRGVDQLDEIVAQIRKDPTTRQAVLQMWGAGRNDLMAYSAKPCNLSASFRVVGNRLNMTVFNRSNDLIWGCCGANAVHFPILQEYIAGRTGFEVGEYWQVSNNLHLYENHIKMFRKRIGNPISDNHIHFHLEDSSKYEATQPLITDPKSFDDDLMDTIKWIDDIHLGQEVYTGDIVNGFLREVVIPMAVAHYKFKNKDMVGALMAIDAVIAEDWKRAGMEWLGRHDVRRYPDTP